MGEQLRVTAVIRSVHSVIVMAHPVPVLCTLLATAGLAFFVRTSPDLSTVLRLVGSMACLQLGIGVLNDYVDLPLDRQTKPWKPLVRGDFRPRTALWLAAGALVAGLLVVAPLGPLVAVLALLGAGAGIVYNLYLKVTAWSWLPYLVALPLLPIWVWTALRGWDGRLLWLYPLGGMMVISLHLADTLPDIRSDTEHGVRGFAHRLGERRSLAVCWAGSLIPPLLSMAVSAVGLVGMRAIAPAALLSLLLTSLAVAYYAQARRRDWRPHFALLAGAAGTLAAGWLLALRQGQ